MRVCTAQGWQARPSSHSAGGGRGTQKQVISWKMRGSSGRERACNIPLLCSSVGFDLKTPGSPFVTLLAGHLERSAQHRVPLGLPDCSFGQGTANRSQA